MPPIVALIAGEVDSPGMRETLGSLAADGIVAFAVGGDGAGLAQAVSRIDWAGDVWLMTPAPGDRIAHGAAHAYREAMSETSARVIFSDDDLIEPCSTLRASPHFKPDWNPELFDHHDFLTGSCVLKARPEALAAAASRGSEWATALVARVIAAGGEVVHLRKVLHHRRARPGPRLRLPAVPISASLPRISAIIPTRNRAELLKKSFNGLAASDYPDIETIVVDNESDDAETLAFLADLPTLSRQGRPTKVLRHDGPFNYSTINNRAVAEASGDLLCLLNNDIEMISTDWLSIMATQALREDVGAVGAKLLYPDGRIQHAGVVIGVGNAAGHAHRLLDPKEEGYFHRHALPQFVTAVTAACLVVRRERFLAVGGLDETNFPVAFNDVDLCLRLNARGWQSLYEPRAVLIHHESVSRGFDRDPVGAARFAGELAALQLRWQTDRIVDPFHHPMLSRASEQFVLAL